MKCSEREALLRSQKNFSLDGPGPAAAHSMLLEAPALQGASSFSSRDSVDCCHQHESSVRHNPSRPAPTRRLGWSIADLCRLMNCTHSFSQDLIFRKRHCICVRHRQKSKESRRASKKCFRQQDQSSNFFGLACIARSGLGLRVLISASSTQARPSIVIPRKSIC